jgi:hypothetical protein
MDGLSISMTAKPAAGLETLFVLVAAFQRRFGAQLVAALG